MHLQHLLHAHPIPSSRTPSPITSRVLEKMSALHRVRQASFPSPSHLPLDPCHCVAPHISACGVLGSQQVGSTRRGAPTADPEGNFNTTALNPLSPPHGGHPHAPISTAPAALGCWCRHEALLNILSCLPHLSRFPFPLRPHAPSISICGGTLMQAGEAASSASHEASYAPPPPPPNANASSRPHHQPLRCVGR